MEKNELRVALEALWAVSLGEDYIAYELPKLCADLLRTSPDSAAINCVMRTGNLVAENSASFEPKEVALFLTYLLRASAEAPQLLYWENWAMPLLVQSAVALDESDIGFLCSLFRDSWSQQAILQAGIKHPDFVRRTREFHDSLESSLYSQWGCVDYKRDYDYEGCVGKYYISHLLTHIRRRPAPTAFAILCLLSVGSLGDEDYEYASADPWLYDSDPVPEKRHWRFEVFLAAITALAQAVRVTDFDFTSLRKTENFRAALTHFWDKQDRTKLPFETLRAFYLLSMALGLCPYPCKDALVGLFPGQSVLPS